MTIPGELSTTQPNTGAAYVLNSREPNAAVLLAQGQRNRQRAEQQEAARKTKEAAAIAKAFNEDLKYKTATGRLFQPGFDEKTTTVVDDLAAIQRQVQDGKISPLEGRRQAANYKNTVEALRIQGEQKQKYWDQRAAQVAADPTRNYDAYSTGLGRTFLNAEGKRVLATEHDEIAIAAALDADTSTYNEPEVVAKYLKNVVPELSQKVAEAGSIGGEHFANEVRGKLIEMKDGKPVLNADGTPRLNLDGGAAELIDQGTIKLLADAREAAYNKQREEREEARKTDPSLPSLPQMSRKGHLASMFGPLVKYSTEYNEGLNPSKPQPRAAGKVGREQVVITPTTARRTSFYRDTPDAAPRPNNYTGVGKSYGSAARPYVEIEANNGTFEIVGKDGQVTRRNPEKGNNNVPLRFTAREYALHTNTGKRLGSVTPDETDEQAFQNLLAFIKNHPDPKKLELRLVGRGTVADKTRVAGDGLGGAVEATGIDKETRQPTYHQPATENQYEVILPITQEIDAQLRRASGKDPRIATPQERALIDAVKARGGRIVTPYSATAPAAATPPKPSTGGVYHKKNAAKPAKTAKTAKATTTSPNTGGAY